MSRGIVYCWWGDRFLREASNSAFYSKRLNIPVVGITDKGSNIRNHVFDDIIEFPFKEHIPQGHIKGFARKTFLYDLSPFDETLYLDTDAIAMSDLTFAFDKLQDHKICLCISTIAYCLNTYINAKSRRMQKEIRKLPVKDSMIQYHAGTFFFKKDDVVKDVFDTWKDWAISTKIEPQTLLSIVLDHKKFNPFVLPRSWNYRPHYKEYGEVHGSVKILHSRDFLPDVDNIKLI